MTERCKRNPCCGDLLDCKPPPQFKSRESYEEYQQRIASLSPAATPVSCTYCGDTKSITDRVDGEITCPECGYEKSAATPVSEAGGEQEAAQKLLDKALNVLGRCHTVLFNMARENKGAIFKRWPIHHEPLRSDARNLLPLIDEVLGDD